MKDEREEIQGGARLQAPFPYFGGKRRVADLVWQRFGDVASYNEPFAGSLAVLLGRPTPPRVETVNDIDSMLANFWRALQHDPDSVARYCDWPVNEADLHSRHKWLVAQLPVHAERMETDPEYFDVKIAGWWVWGQCLWIGSGWCQSPDWVGRVNAGRRARGVHVKRPKLRKRGTDGVAFGRNGRGTVHQQRRPQLSGDQGVHRRWQGGGAGGGSGVHAPTLTQQVPLLRASASASGMGVNSTGRSDGLYEYLATLAARLRRVRVCCGDWRRVLTPSATS